MTHERTALPAVAFGAAYYAEYQPTPRLDDDLDLMRDAGFTVIRVGESVWSTWEPRDGEFDLEWLEPVLDGARARGIGVILGTPTYALPPWLFTKHPELAAHNGTRTSEWGSRQEVDYSQPLFRTYAERVIRAILDRYAQHPAIVGFQVDNEPGLHLFHNDGAFDGFREHLESKYGDVETLNREWGLVYWSHRLSDWSELWRPEGNAQPQYDLAWRRYQADITTEFIGWQADIVREYRAEEQFVTTCIAFPRGAVDDERVSERLDVTASNIYYGTQDHLEFDTELDAPAPGWTTSGVAGLLRQADRAYSSKQGNFLVTETNASTIGLSDFNQPGYPGQLKLAALAFVSRGASMIEYWHWNTLHYGTETYWGGVLPHSQRPGRFYREAAEIGSLLQSAGDGLAGLVPDADVALIYSNDSKWAFEFTPPMQRSDGSRNPHSYEDIFDAFHAGVVDAGRQARILHVDQLDADPDALAARFPVLVAPALYVTADEHLDLLHAYAAAGGHLIVGPRTGYTDLEARARFAVAPPVLTSAAGVWYEELSSLATPVRLVASAGFDLDAGAHATGLLEGLHAEGAEILAHLDHRELGRFAAATTQEVGDGRITYVGTVPDRAFARSILRWAAPQATADRWRRSASVAITSAVAADGRRVWFVGNWSGEPGWVVPPDDVTDLAAGTTLSAGALHPLEPWAAVVLADGSGRRSSRPTDEGKKA